MFEYGVISEGAAIAASVSRQDVGFTDPGVVAIIEMCRIGARFLIMLTVMLAAGHWAYGGYLLYSSGGDPRRISQGQDVIKNTLVGVVLAVTGYMIINTILTIYTGIAGFDRVVLFRPDDKVGYGLEVLLREDEIALEGEVIIFVGSKAFACEPSLANEAKDAGWTYIVRLPNANHLSGCVRTAQPAGNTGNTGNNGGNNGNNGGNNGNNGGNNGNNGGGGTQ